MSEVPHAGEHHGHAMLVGGGDDFLVAHGAAGLDHRGNAGSSSAIDTVAERKEGVGSHDRALDDQTRMFGLAAYEKIARLLGEIKNDSSL